MKLSQFRKEYPKLQHENLLIVGRVADGKVTAIMQIAEATKRPFVRLECSKLDILMPEFNEEAICLLDCLHKMNDETSAGLMHSLEHPERLADGVTFIATTNKREFDSIDQVLIKHFNIIELE